MRSSSALLVTRACFSNSRSASSLLSFSRRQAATAHTGSVFPPLRGPTSDLPPPRSCSLPRSYSRFLSLPVQPLPRLPLLWYPFPPSRFASRAWSRCSGGRRALDLDLPIAVCCKNCGPNGGRGPAARMRSARMGQKGHGVCTAELEDPHQKTVPLQVLDTRALEIVEDAFPGFAKSLKSMCRSQIVMS